MAKAAPDPPVDALDVPLQEGVRALGVSLQPDQSARLLAYVAMLQRWNAVHNLSAARDPRELLTLHVLDSLATVPPLRRHAAGRSLRVLDAGTGAGLPAVILAIALPSWRVQAVDAVGKKIAFVRQVIGELGLANLVAVHARVEDLQPEASPLDLVISRAFASLEAFVGRTRHLMVSPDAVWVAMKGKLPRDEIDALPAECQLFHVEPLSVPGLAAQRCLVWMRPTTASPSIA